MKFNSNSDYTKAHIFCGKFSSERALQQALVQFADHVGADEGDQKEFVDGNFWIAFSGASSYEDLADTCSSSVYYDKVMQCCSKMKGNKSPNAFLVTVDLAPEGKLEGSKFSYLGAFPFKTQASTKNEEGVTKQHKERFSVWIGTFKTKKAAESYFDENHVSRGPTTPFDREFDLGQFFVDDFGALLLANQMKLNPVAEFINAQELPSESHSQVIDAAEDMGLETCNFLYAAYTTTSCTRRAKSPPKHEPPFLALSNTILITGPTQQEAIRQRPNQQSRNRVNPRFRRAARKRQQPRRSNRSSGCCREQKLGSETTLPASQR